MQQHGSKYCARRHMIPGGGGGGGTKGQNIFSVSSHIAHQIKKNAYSTMQAHSLSLSTPSTCEFGSKAHIFKNINELMLHIKLKLERSTDQHAAKPST